MAHSLVVLWVDQVFAMFSVLLKCHSNIGNHVTAMSISPSLVFNKWTTMNSVPPSEVLLNVHLTWTTRILVNRWQFTSLSSSGLNIWGFRWEVVGGWSNCMPGTGARLVKRNTLANILVAIYLSYPAKNYLSSLPFVFQSAFCSEDFSVQRQGTSINFGINNNEKNNCHSQLKLGPNS